MATYGYKLMSEEHGPADLVANACLAEEVGFDFVAISDHFHPWVSAQGHSSFAWSVLGAIAARTARVGLVTAVTCPTLRYHPAIIAQAAATISLLSKDRFTLGLGAGENLNEHVVGRGWPSPHARQSMLAEAVDIIRTLWEGKEVSLHGEHFTLDRAKLWDAPESPPQLAVAAGGPKAARMAGEKGVGLFATEARKDLVDAHRASGGAGGRYAEVPLCYASSEAEGARIAHERFAFGSLGWKVMAELPTPASFESAVRFIRREDVAKSVACGPDPERHVEAVKPFLEAGFDHLVLLHAGPDQPAFLRFFERELGPRLRREGAALTMH